VGTGTVGRRDTPPPPCFLQVLIPKAVEVLCFDTLLQVLILKGLRATSEKEFGRKRKELDDLGGKMIERQRDSEIMK
jgi:hypothetical protein